MKRGETMNETTLPKSTSELLDQIEREWSALKVVIGKLSPDQMVTPDTGGWSPKDNLAHLSEWMKILFGYYMDKRPAHEVTGIDPAVTDKWDYEAMNKLFFERNRHRSIEDVMGELEQVHAELLARLKSIPFEDLLVTLHPGEPEKRPLLLAVIGNTSEHFEEHRLTIEKAL
jgi:hypothetical protein